jgi:hypothetical protein
MKCPNCNQPQSNDDWCGDCLKQPLTAILKNLVEEGHLRDTGKRQRGHTVWQLTDAGMAHALREQGRLS